MSRNTFCPVITLVHMVTLASTGLISYMVLSSHVSSQNYPNVVFTLAAVLSFLISHLLYVTGMVLSKIAVRHKDSEQPPQHTRSDALYYLVRRNTGMDLSISLLALINRLVNSILKRHVIFQESYYFNELVACITVLWITMFCTTSFRLLLFHYNNAPPLTPPR